MALLTVQITLSPHCPISSEVAQFPSPPFVPGVVHTASSHTYSFYIIVRLSAMLKVKTNPQASLTLESTCSPVHCTIVCLYVLL